jgi:hypothetical protein
MAFHGLENEAAFQQLPLGFGQHVRRLPAPCFHEGARQQHASVIVAVKLPGNLQQQRSCVHGQAGVGWTI